MKYLINEDGEYAGVDYLGDQPNSVDLPPKPLFDHETATWSGDHWEYTRIELPSVRPLLKEMDESASRGTRLWVELFTKACARMALGGGPRDIPKEKNITVLIPCYGKANYIERAVKSCLQQTMKPYQVYVLLMDEKSRKLKSELEALDPRVVAQCHERLNASAARNYLVEKCPTEYFILLDGDDTLHKNFIKYTYEEDASIVFTQKIWSKKGKLLYRDGGNTAFFDCQAGQNLTFLQCKTAWNEVGGLDEELCWGGEDTDYIIRLFCTNWRIRVIYNTWYIYDQNASELAKSEAFEDCYFKMLRKERSNILKGLNAQRSKKDAIYRVFEDENNFIDKETARKKFLHLTGWESRYQDISSFENLIELAKKSREKECYSVWNEEDYEGECPACFRSTCFDAIILEPVTINTEEVKMCIRKDITLIGTTLREKLEYLFKNYCVFTLFKDDPPILKEEEEEEEEEYTSHVITVALHYDCNLQCPYCNQAVTEKPHPHFSDEEIYERFDKILTKLENIFDGKILPQVLGGEPTIWSEWLIKKVWERLEKYPMFYIYSNHVIKDSLWEKNSKVLWREHITDWHGKILEPITNHFFMIVVCKEDIPYLDDFLTLNENTHIYVDEYVGPYERFQLTVEDRDKMSSILSKHSSVNRAACMYNEVVHGTEEDREKYHEKCRLSINNVQGSSVYNCFWPCCGIGVPTIPFDEYNGEPTPKEYCQNCNYYNRI